MPVKGKIPVAGDDWQAEMNRVRVWIAANPTRGYKTCAMALHLDEGWVRQVGPEARKLPLALANPTRAPARERAEEPVEPREWQDETSEDFLKRMLLEVEEDIENDRVPNGSGKQVPALRRLQRGYRAELDAIEEKRREKEGTGLDDAQLLSEIANIVIDMPERHLRVYVDEYLRRHRVMLVRDPTQMEKIGGSEEGDSDDPDDED